MPQMLASSNARLDLAAAAQLGDISRLSGIATELVAIRQSLSGNDEVGRRLEDIVAGLDATITVLLRATPVPADEVAPDAAGLAALPGRAPPAGERLDIDESVFLAWLVDPVMPDELPAGPEWSAEPVTHLLGRLSLSPQRLTADQAMVVGMPAGTSLGNVAIALLLAVEDPAGPRCRSYRAATYFLQQAVEPFHSQPESPRRFARRARTPAPATRTDA
jgi:hypothetical protein